MFHRNCQYIKHMYLFLFRHRQSGDSKYVAKLTLDELQCFNEQVNGLPCAIAEARLIQELLDKVVDFQKRAQDALQEETPDSAKLEKLVEAGVTLDVDLPEIPKLKQVMWVHIGEIINIK